jgi:hypothetical protein
MSTSTVNPKYRLSAFTAGLDKDNVIIQPVTCEQQLKTGQVLWSFVDINAGNLPYQSIKNADGYTLWTHKKSHWDMTRV